MSTPTSGVESGEDPDNVPLVRLAKASASPAVSTVSDKKSTTSFDYVESNENTCEDSNEGSASAQSEEPEVSEGTEEEEDEEDDSDSGEMIVPEFVPDELPIDIPTQEPHGTNQPGGWPTLEILPGGVIKRGDKDDEDPVPPYPEETDPMEDGGELMYACAKCPERFNLLFSLVKHVRMHEDERRRLQRTQLAKMSRLEKELVEIKRERLDVLRSYKQQKSEVMSRIASAMGDLEEIFHRHNK